MPTIQPNNHRIQSSRSARKSRFLANLGFMLAVAVLVPGAMPAESSHPRVGEAVDVVPFGGITHWEENGLDYGVMWEDSRDIVKVTVTFDAGATLPSPDSIRLQYWKATWPQRRIPREEPSGAGSSGWLDIGDWYQGRWQDGDVNLTIHGNRYEYTFNPVNAREFKDVGDFDAPYRSTLKLRIISDQPLPKIVSLQAFTDSVWQEQVVEIEWGGTAEAEQDWSGRLEAFNAHVLHVEPYSSASRVMVSSDWSWQSTTQDQTDGIRARILYAKPQGYNSFDESIVTVRAQQETFSFAMSDLIRWKTIFISDYGVLVRLAGETETYASARERWTQEKNRDLYARVFQVPEQTFTQAWNDMPAKAAHYIPLSFEGSRQHFRLDENGNVTCVNGSWIARIRGKDTDRCLWNGGSITYRLGLPGGQPSERELLDGDMPVIFSRWELNGIRATQTAFAIPLLGIPNAGGRVWADDTLVLMIRLELENPTSEDREVVLPFRVADAEGEQKLVLTGDQAIAQTKDGPLPRFLVRSLAKTDEFEWKEIEKSLEYHGYLPPLSSQTLEIAIPYITLTSENEWKQLAALRWDDAYQSVSQYWRGRIDAGTGIYTPEPMINEFYRAHAAHLLINTEREVGLSDRYMAKVGTFHYGVYSNESCMMISDLDRRGYSERARQALETWIHYQGTVALPGDYSTAEGVFYGAGGYEAGGYNQHHGWVLWCLGEHYWYTRDAEWLNRVAPNIVKACDWITGQRRRNEVAAAQLPLRTIEQGLLPPGSLEDIGDWRVWLSTNVYSWWGMKNAADALADVQHPEAGRLQAEADEYHQAILDAFTEAMRRSPVVRLRDGSWIPHIPSEVHRRGRSFGWITETLEGAIHLVRCGVLEPWDRRSTWIIKDFEDNLYLSEQFGYNLTGRAFERFWFSHGGISMQANLLCNPIPYLQRDEPRHFLRAYFNAFAASYFPDTRMMTEHALPAIGDWRGDHYKTSDEANSTYWLRLMFAMEQGDQLWLGAAIPRYWLADGQKIGIERSVTYFGVLSMRMESHADEGYILMTIDPPRRNPPREMYARFRHPEGKRMVRCTVNGEPHEDFDPEKEWVRVTPGEEPIEIAAYYE